MKLHLDNTVDGVSEPLMARDVAWYRAPLGVARPVIRGAPAVFLYRSARSLFLRRIAREG